MIETLHFISNPTIRHSIDTVVLTEDYNYQYHIFGETKGIEVVYADGKVFHI